jgi:hypothetical protein
MRTGNDSKSGVSSGATLSNPLDTVTFLHSAEGSGDILDRFRFRQGRILSARTLSQALETSRLGDAMVDKRLLNRVTVVQPCAASWELMKGTDTIRSCAKCNRDVHDLSAMTSSEAERLLARDDEKVCIVFTRRADGRIATIDQPGPPFRRRPLAGFSAAALAAFLGVSQPRASSAAGVPAAQVGPQNPATRDGAGSAAKTHYGSLAGTVRDFQGVVPGATVTARNEATGQEFTSESGEDGRYVLPLPPGRYTVRVSFIVLLAPYEASGVWIRSGGRHQLDAALHLRCMGECVTISGDNGLFRNILTAPFRGLKRLLQG